MEGRDVCVSCVGGMEGLDEGVVVDIGEVVRVQGHVARWGVRGWPEEEIFGGSADGARAVNPLRSWGVGRVPRGDCMRVIVVSQRYVACVNVQGIVHFLQRDSDGEMRRIYSADLQRSSEIFDDIQTGIDLSQIAVVEFKGMLAVMWYAKKSGNLFLWRPRIGFLKFSDHGILFEMSYKSPEFSSMGDPNNDVCYDCKSKAILSPEGDYIYYCVPHKTDLMVIKYWYNQTEGAFIANLIEVDIVSISSFAHSGLIDLVSYEVACQNLGCLFGFYDTKGFWWFKFFLHHSQAPERTLPDKLITRVSLPPPLSEIPSVSKFFDTSLSYQNRTLCSPVLERITLFGARLAYFVFDNQIKTVDFCFYRKQWNAGIFRADDFMDLIPLNPEVSFMQIPSYYLPSLGQFDAFHCFGNHIVVRTKLLKEVELSITLYLFEIGNSHVIQEYELPYQLGAIPQFRKENETVLMTVFDPSTSILQEYTLGQRMLQIEQPYRKFPSQLAFTFHGSRDFTYPAQVVRAIFGVTLHKDRNQVCFKVIHISKFDESGDPKKNSTLINLTAASNTSGHSTEKFNTFLSSLPLYTFVIAFRTLGLLVLWIL